MVESDREKMSFKRAIYLALIALCIYYPVTIAANIPLNHWMDLGLAFPAVVHLVFYVLLIVAIDRIIDLFGPGILEVNLRTIVLSLAVAVVAVIVSQFLFKLNMKAWYMISDPFRPGGNGDRPRMMWTALGRANYSLTFVISLSIFYLILNRKSNSRLRQMEVQAQQLIKQNALAQFEALKNQVSPHFLFNSLSILSSLVHIDPNLSERFIDQLSKAYRYILEQKDNDTVTLGTEIDFLQSYSFLLKIRFENKFDVKTSVTDEQREKYRIAPLTLQLLIENAVKHNRMSEKEPLVVSILISNDYLVVRNPVRPRSETEKITSTGIGLANIRNRYELLTRLPVQIDQDEELFTVKIPLI